MDNLIWLGGVQRERLWARYVQERFRRNKVNVVQHKRLRVIVERRPDEILSQEGLGGVDASVLSVTTVNGDEKFLLKFLSFLRYPEAIHEYDEPIILCCRFLWACITSMLLCLADIAISDEVKFSSSSE